MGNTFICNPATLRISIGFAVRFGMIVLLLILFPNLSNGAANVTATYTKSHGTELIVSITVTTPTPSSLILVQHLPPGVRITHAQPAAKNINLKKGQAKWLIKEVTPGTQTIRMSLDQTVAEQDISATIRYKPAKDGKMRTLPVAKP